MTELKYVFGKIKWLLLLLATQLVSAVFTLIKERRLATFPDEYIETRPYFLFSDYELTKATYWHYLMQYVVAVMFAVYILNTNTEFKTALRVFLLIQVIALLDYVLNYSEIWFYASNFPMSWNVLKTVCFMLAIINEVLLIKEREAMLR